MDDESPPAMLAIVNLTALLLVAVTMGLSLAHALEFPGKLRLEEQTYRAVQAIYYPGFTIGGLIGEFGGMLALVVLILLTPKAPERFWRTVAALGFLVIGHAMYWVVTHPANAAWLKDTTLSGGGADVLRVVFLVGDRLAAYAECLGIFACGPCRHPYTQFPVFGTGRDG